MRKTKLTYDLIQRAAALRGDGLSNADICAALGIAESTFYRWMSEPKGKLQREFSEELKKAESAYKRTLLTTIRSAALAKNQYWTAAAWLLERKYPGEFAQAPRTREERGVAAPRIVLGVEVGPVQERLPGFGNDAGSAPGEGGTDG